MHYNSEFNFQLIYICLKENIKFLEKFNKRLINELSLKTEIYFPKINKANVLLKIDIDDNFLREVDEVDIIQKEFIKMIQEVNFNCSIVSDDDSNRVVLTSEHIKICDKLNATLIFSYTVI